MDTTDLLFHPVRLRILNAADGKEQVTTAELAAGLPDVATATLYRQVGVLADAGLLEVVREERVRGAVERHYRLRKDLAIVDDESAAALSADDHRRGFAAVIAVLLAEFETYIARPDADPVADRIGYRQISLWLDDAEKTALVEDVLATIKAHAGKEPAPGRRRHLLTPIFYPTGEPAGTE